MECDRSFHMRLYDIAAIQLLLRINEMFNIMRVSYQRGLLRDPNETLLEHLSIIEAIKNRDAELAERLARTHVLRSRAVLLRVLEEKEER
ncbi:MAG: FCD domain-containing protein [Firmicutes bacterium]|nr:FCD domain-containing protein [Bacillota bacterium]